MTRLFLLLLVAITPAAQAVTEAEITRQKEVAKQLRAELATKVSTLPTTTADIRVFASLSPMVDAIKAFDALPPSRREVRVRNSTDTGNLITFADDCNSTLGLKGVSALSARGQVSNLELTMDTNRVTFATHLRLTGDISTRLQLRMGTKTPSKKTCSKIADVADPTGTLKKTVCKIIPAVTICPGGGTGIDLPAVGLTLDTVVEAMVEMIFDSSTGRFQTETSLTKPKLLTFSLAIDPGHGLPKATAPLPVPLPLDVRAQAAFSLLISKDDLKIPVPGSADPVYMDVAMTPVDAHVDPAGLSVGWVVNLKTHAKPTAAR
jgi:hypothetical protein